MPVSGEEMEVRVQRRGDGAFIKFIYEDNLAASMEDMPTILKIEYGDGCAMIGIPNAHTMRMLFAEFPPLTDGWRLLRHQAIEEMRQSM
jgi:hypothetical protein